LALTEDARESINASRLLSTRVHGALRNAVPSSVLSADFNGVRRNGRVRRGSFSPVNAHVATDSGDSNSRSRRRGHSLDRDHEDVRASVGVASTGNSELNSVVTDVRCNLDSHAVGLLVEVLSVVNLHDILSLHVLIIEVESKAVVALVTP
jgi:hypothetical protein